MVLLGAKICGLFFLVCVLFVAIEACKKEISGGSTTTDYMQGQSECSEQTSSDGPVLEEFIPIKRSSDCSEEDDEQESRKSKDHDTNTKEKNVAAADKKKSDWLRSVQLWNNNQSPDPPLQEVTIFFFLMFHS